MRNFSLFMSIVLLGLVLDGIIIHPEIFDKISLAGTEYSSYFEQNKLKFYEKIRSDTFGEVKLILNENIQSKTEPKIYISELSFDEAYKDGKGKVFVNGTELNNGEYFFVIETLNENNMSIFFLKKVLVSNGIDKEIIISYKDDIRNNELLGINIKNVPKSITFLEGNKLHLDGTVIDLIYDSMSITIDYYEFEFYSIYPYIVNQDNVSILKYDSLLNKEDDGYMLYLGDNTFNKNVKLMTLKIDENIRHYNEYGEFFTEETEYDKYIRREARASYDYFIENINNDATSTGYGLVPSNINQGIKSTEASIVAVANTLTSTIIAIENGWIEPEDGYKVVTELINTSRNLETFLGFYYDVYDLNTGSVIKESKISITDSSLFFASLLTTGEYFGGYIEEMAKEIYQEAKWHTFYSKNKKGHLYNTYTELGGFDELLDKYNNQLLAYILMAGNIETQFLENPYYNFQRSESDGFYYTWYGGLEGHILSNLFVDNRYMQDKDGINWYENSVKATKHSKKFTDNLTLTYKSFFKGWGLSAGDTLSGYKYNLGVAPSGYTDNLHVVDGTIPTYTALSSIVFTPEQSIDTLIDYYNIENLVGEYGLYSAFDIDENWVSLKYNAKEKGIALAMLSNYKSNIIWNLFMQTDEAKIAFDTLEFESDFAPKDYDEYFDSTTKLFYNPKGEDNSYQINNINNIKNKESFYITLYEQKADIEQLDEEN